MVGWSDRIKVVNEEDVLPAGGRYCFDYSLSKLVLLDCVHGLELLKSHEFGSEMLHEFADGCWRMDVDGDVFVSGELSIRNVYTVR